MLISNLHEHKLHHKIVWDTPNTFHKGYEININISWQIYVPLRFLVDSQVCLSIATVFET